MIAGGMNVAATAGFRIVRVPGNKKGVLKSTSAMWVESSSYSNPICVPFTSVHAHWPASPSSSVCVLVIEKTMLVSPTAGVTITMGICGSDELKGLRLGDGVTSLSRADGRIVLRDHERMCRDGGCVRQ